MAGVYDYAIIGAGMSGIAFARMLQLSGLDSFIVLEAEAEPGGLCRTRIIDGHVLDIGGGHFWCTKYPEVDQFLAAHYSFDMMNIFDRVSKVIVAGQEIDYPIESNIWQMSAELRTEYLISIVRNGESRGAPAPSDFEEWVRWKLGDRIADDYMVPYNRKIWGVDPTQMDIDWLHKIPRLDVKEIVSACLNSTSDRAKMPSHAKFRYPKVGGFQSIFDAVAKPVLSHVVCASPVHQIEARAEGLEINGKYRARRVVNTAPWRTLSTAEIFREIRPLCDNLQHNSLVVSLHENQPQRKSHWEYIPDPDVPHHRVFHIPNFALDSKPNGSYRETNLHRWRPGSGSIFHHVNDAAYPIPVKGWKANISAILEFAASRGVYGLGRWGQWEYFNSDVCIHEAMKLARRFGHIQWEQTLACASHAPG